MTMLDCVTEAAGRVNRGDAGGIDWVWHHVMSERDRVAFDLWLVKMGDSLAFEAGSPRSRFQRCVTRLVEGSKRHAG